MPYEYNLKDDEIMFLRHYGKSDYGELLAARVVVADIMKSKGMKKLLVDMLEIDLKISLADLMEFNETHKNFFVPGTKISVAYDPKFWNADDIKFAENVSANNFTKMNAFPTLEEAEKRLKDRL